MQPVLEKSMYCTCTKQNLVSGIEIRTAGFLWLCCVFSFFFEKQSLQDDAPCNHFSTICWAWWLHWSWLIALIGEFKEDGGHISIQEKAELTMWKREKAGFHVNTLSDMISVLVVSLCHKEQRFIIINNIFNTFSCNSYLTGSSAILTCITALWSPRKQGNTFVWYCTLSSFLLKSY